MKRLEILRTDAFGYAYKAECQNFSKDFYTAIPVLDLDCAVASHEVLGFGVSITDASAYMISKLPEEKQTELLKDLFTPAGLNLSIGRLNVGSSDYASGVYCYDETPDDFELKDFSIAQDEEYLIPLIRKIRACNPDLYLFSSPWSPPGWMKTGGTMCGGCMRWKYLPVFADYYVKYLQSYLAAGIEINAVTMQNEADTDQGGTMPQSYLHPDFEAELVGRLMPERLKKAGLNTKLWLYDHNYSNWNRVLYMLSDPDVRKNIDAVAFHPYAGTPDMMKIVKKAYPESVFQLTEKGPNLRDGSAESHLFWWAKTIFGALNNGSSSFVGWNCALNENGEPNVGPFDCAGLVEINSLTGEITPSVQYRAFRHIAPYIPRGAKILDLPCNFPMPDNVCCVVSLNPDGTHTLVCCNGNETMKAFQIKYKDLYLRVPLRPRSMETICF